MDADVLYHPGILQRLLASEHKDCFLMDRNFEPGDEPVKIAVHEGIMVEFRKVLPEGVRYDVLGESVGFFKFQASSASLVANECQRFSEEGLIDSPHEEVLRNLLLNAPEDFGLEDISGLPWVEIDFPADVRTARDDILPAIEGEVS